MPTHNGVRVHDDQSCAPILPRLGEQHPKQLISVAELGTPHGALEQGQLLTKCQIFERHGSVSTADQRERSKCDDERSQHELSCPAISQRINRGRRSDFGERQDIDIYNIVRQRFSEPSVGRVLPLTLNFRSAPQLCNWANEVFKTRFPVEPTVHAPRFASLDADPDKKISGDVFTLAHTCDKGDLQAEDAEQIARYIRSEVDAGRRQFNDFLILTRKKKDRIGPYAHALEALNIAVEVSGAGAFGDSREVQALTVLLRALADPQDPLSLIAVLRGPLFGISDPELFDFKQRGGWFSVFQDSDAPGQLDGPVSAALAALNRYYRWTRVLPAAGALERVLEDSGYLALAATTPGGVDAGDVVHAVDRVRQVVETGGSPAALPAATSRHRARTW